MNGSKWPFNFIFQKIPNLVARRNCKTYNKSKAGNSKQPQENKTKQIYSIKFSYTLGLTQKPIEKKTGKKFNLHFIAFVIKIKK